MAATTLGEQADERRDGHLLHDRTGERALNDEHAVSVAMDPGAAARLVEVDLPDAVIQPALRAALADVLDGLARRKARHVETELVAQDVQRRRLPRHLVSRIMSGERTVRAARNRNRHDLEKGRLGRPVPEVHAALLRKVQTLEVLIRQQSLHGPAVPIHEHGHTPHRVLLVHGRRDGLVCRVGRVHEDLLDARADCVLVIPVLFHVHLSLLVCVSEDFR